MRMHKGACVHFSTNLQSLMVVQWINSSMNSQLNCPPFQIVCFTRQPISQELLQGREGGQPQRGEFQFKIFIWPYGINSSCFQPHISQNLCPVLPAGRVVIPCQQSACPGKALTDIRQAEERGLSKSRLLNFWLQCTHEMLSLLLYLYWVMVKREH